MSKRTSRTFLKANNRTLKQKIYQYKLQERQIKERRAYLDRLLGSKWFKVAMLFVKKRNRPSFDY